MSNYLTLLHANIALPNSWNKQNPPSDWILVHGEASIHLHLWFSGGQLKQAIYLNSVQIWATQENHLCRPFNSEEDSLGLTTDR